MALRPAPGEVHCWSVRLDVPPETFASLHATLASDERSRSERLRFERDRRRFVVARGALRDVLGRYVGMRPDLIAFAYNAFGKPGLSPALGSRLRFNLSHSADLALIAVAAEADVGVDVEWVPQEAEGARPWYAEIARCFFSAAEIDHCGTVPSHLRAQAFFSCWTVREAYLKALGRGLGDGPEEYRGSWSFFGLQPAPGYVGTLAVEGAGWRLGHWLWPAGPWPAPRPRGAVAKPAPPRTPRPRTPRRRPPSLPGASRARSTTTASRSQRT